MVKISISASHDGGNIQFLSQSPLTSSLNDVTCTISLSIRPDVYTESERCSHMQYFSFRSFVSGLDDGVTSITVRYEIVNASEASFPYAWPGTTVCYSTGSLDASDDALWKRNLTTKYVDGKLAWSHTHQDNGSTFFSYYPPYTWERHLKLISDCTSQVVTARPLAEYNPTVESLGQTAEGREVECLSLGKGRLVGWIVHRQHPGENMAEFYAEGLLRRLFGLDGELDRATKRTLEKFRLHVVPCMCPDGVVRGHIRTNGVGANLNREWGTVEVEYEAPTLERSPEVYWALKKMDETGCDFFLDVHGDESIPHVFFNGPVDTPKWDERMKALQGYFVNCYRRHNSDVQKEFGYEPPEVLNNPKVLNKASKQVSNRFNCLGLTLEMPYKDCATNPDPERGWSPNRAKGLGRSLIEALDGVAGYLRMEGEFWREFGEEDAFVLPRLPEGL